MSRELSELELEDIVWVQFIYIQGTLHNVFPRAIYYVVPNFLKRLC